MFKKEKLTLVPASDGRSMQPFIDWLRTYSTLKPMNVFEIGANMAQDADWLKTGFELKDLSVWVFEPHPQLYSHIKKNYKFNAYNYAVGDKSGSIILNAIYLNKNANSGISSIRVHNDVPGDNFISTKVKSIRMDDFMDKHEIKEIDFLKLDVEGYNYEVLRGFGERIKDLNSLHVEAEHYEHWQGEKMWEDLRAYLEQHMEMVYFERHFTQSDSFWIKKEFIRAI